LNKYSRTGFQQEILFGCNITYSPRWPERKLSISCSNCWCTRHSTVLTP